MAKLELYRKFTNSLAMSVLISIAWIGYEVCVMSIISLQFENIPTNGEWKNSWCAFSLLYDVHIYRLVI